MHRFLFALFFAFAIACVEESDTQPQASNKPQKNELPKEIHEERPARLFVPDDYDPNKNYPLVIQLHGYSANALVQEFVFGLKDRVTKNQYVLLFPDGTEDSRGSLFWNGTPECCDFDDQDIDDVAYIKELIAEAAELTSIDVERVSLVGHSNGGYMSYRFACEANEYVNRIVVLAGSTFLTAEECYQDQPVNLVHIHGTNDETILYYATTESAPTVADNTVETIGAEATVERWLGRAGCSTTPSSSESADLVDGLEGEESTIEIYDDCSTGKTVEFWKVQDGDHLFVDASVDFKDRIANIVGQ